MTTQEKLQAVTEAIRKALPRLMEVSEGCLIKHVLSNRTNKIVSITNILIGIIDVEERDYMLCNKKDFKNSFEIIGKEPTILDVLEWLSTINEWAIDNYGNILKSIHCSKSYCEFEINNVKIDLSKPYLKDQSEEVIEFLYNLKNQ